MMAEMEAAIQRLWARLPQVGAFSFTANNGEGSATDWNGRGEGGGAGGRSSGGLAV